MAQVTCIYCKNKFDREKEDFIQIPRGKTFRYAHAACYQGARDNGIEQNEYEIFSPINGTTCFWCGRAMQKESPDIELVPGLTDRFAHKECNEQHPCDDRERLILYIMSLYGISSGEDLPKYLLQLKKFEKDYQFTYSGMLKSLKYWYEVKHNTVDKSKGLGIIPYVYPQAREYYLALFMAQQNGDKKITIKDIDIEIKPPKRKIAVRNLFHFLDDDDVVME